LKTASPNSDTRKAKPKTLGSGILKAAGPC